MKKWLIRAKVDGAFTATNRGADRRSPGPLTDARRVMAESVSVELCGQVIDPTRDYFDEFRVPPHLPTNMREPGCAPCTMSALPPKADISYAQKKDRLVSFLVGTSAVQSELTIMTYQSETRREKRDDKFYTSWIVRGGIVLAIVIAALAFISTGTYPDRDVPQIIRTVPGPAS